MQPAHGIDTLFPQPSLNEGGALRPPGTAAELDVGRRQLAGRRHAKTTQLRRHRRGRRGRPSCQLPLSLGGLGLLSATQTSARRCPRACAPPQGEDLPGAAALGAEPSAVFAVEVGGRWSDEAASFVRALARAKALDAPVRLRCSLIAVLVARVVAKGGARMGRSL